MQICCPVSLFNLPFRWESAGVGSKLQRQLDPRVSIRNPLHNAHVFRLDTVALQHNSFVSCHRTVTLEHSSNASALAQACREKHSVFAHVHNRKEISLTWKRSVLVSCANSGKTALLKSRPLEEIVGEPWTIVIHKWSSRPPKHLRFRATAVSLRVRLSRLSLYLCRG